MKRINVGAMVVCLALMVLAFPPWTNADTWNKRTVVTFSGPVEIPGVGAQVLPAGTYVFKLLDSQSDRHIVQIFNERGDHVFATILAIPNYRLKATDKTVMTFRERAAGDPQAIRAWFYPGNTWGQEFVYPKKRAIELAQFANVPVLAMPTELATNLTLPIVKADEAPVIALKEAPLEAVTPAGEAVAITEVVEPHRRMQLRCRQRKLPRPLRREKACPRQPASCRSLRWAGCCRCSRDSFCRGFRSDPLEDDRCGHLTGNLFQGRWTPGAGVTSLRPGPTGGRP